MYLRPTLVLLLALGLLACESYLEGRAEVVYFTCHGATDKNGDNELQPDEFQGLGKTKFKSGETVFFGVTVPGSAVGSRVFAALRSPSGKKREYGRIGIVSDTVNTFGVGAPVDRLIAWGGPGEWAMEWGIDGVPLNTVTVTLR